MNLVTAKSLLPIKARLDRSPTLAYLPKPLRARWWRPRATFAALSISRLLNRRAG